MAAKKDTSALKDLKMAFGDDVRWLADGPALEREHNYKGASVEMQRDYDREDGRARAIVLVSKNGLAQATFKPGRDIMFSHEMDNETEEKAWKLAGQLVAMLDIRAAASLTRDKKSAQIDKTALLGAVRDIDPAYIPKDKLIALHDDLAVLGPRGAEADQLVLKVIHAEAETAARDLVQGARHIKAEFGKVAKDDDRALDETLYGLNPTFEKIDGNLPFLRREFLTQASAQRTAKALGQVAGAMDGLTGGFRTVYSGFGDRVKAQALGVS